MVQDAPIPNNGVQWQTPEQIVKAEKRRVKEAAQQAAKNLRIEKEKRAQARKQRIEEERKELIELIQLRILQYTEYLASIQYVGGEIYKVARTVSIRKRWYGARYLDIEYVDVALWLLYDNSRPSARVWIDARGALYTRRRFNHNGGYALTEKHESRTRFYAKRPLHESMKILNRNRFENQGISAFLRSIEAKLPGQ